MLQTNVTALDHAVHQMNAWMEKLEEKEPFRDREDAYSALRAVLHALRDRLTVEEAVHLAEQMPMIARGIYYEGWRPALAPNEEVEKQPFLDKVRDSLGDKHLKIPAEPATRALFGFLEDELSEGQIEHVKSQLPDPVKALFPSG